MLIKRISLFLASICFVSALAACPQAESTTSANFCASFKEAAECHCYPLPKLMCQDMEKLYSRMLAIYQSVETACRSQHDTTVQNCIDDWHCYREGGLDSKGNLCSGTGNKCG